VLQKANVQPNPAVIKSGITGERGQIHTRVIHGTVGVGCLLKAEHGAVELGGDLDVVHDDVDVGNGLNISSRGKVGHCSSPRNSNRITSIARVGDRATGQRTLTTATPPDYLQAP
jgi:hypothetical protein